MTPIWILQTSWATSGQTSSKDLGDEYAVLSYGDLMTDEDWVKKLLKLCEQKYGSNAPAMRQLRRQLETIRQPEPNVIQRFVPGRGMQRTGEALTAPMRPERQLGEGTARPGRDSCASRRSARLRSFLGPER